MLHMPDSRPPARVSAHDSIRLIVALQNRRWRSICSYPGGPMSPSVDDLILRHFGLRENPFGVTPDPRFLFMTRTHREALASLVNGIECGFGFPVLVAQPGIGKTTLLFDLLERFHSSRTAFLFQQQDDPRESLQSLLI